MRKVDVSVRTKFSILCEKIQKHIATNGQTLTLHTHISTKLSLATIRIQIFLNNGGKGGHKLNGTFKYSSVTKDAKINVAHDSHEPLFILNARKSLVTTLR